MYNKYLYLPDTSELPDAFVLLILYQKTEQRIKSCFPISIVPCCEIGDQKTDSVPSVRFEVGVSLLLAPAGADKRGPFSSSGKCRNTAGDLREYLLELWWELGLNESTGSFE